MKLRLRKSRSKGSTLIGFLVSTAIAVIVVSALISAYITVKGKYN